MFTILFLTGCSSYPMTSGHWIGKVSSKTLYADAIDDSHECQVAYIHVVNGTTLSASVGYDLFLVDYNDHVIDASSFPPGTYVKVSGEAGCAQVTDAHERFVNSVKDSLGAMESVLRVDKLSDTNGKAIKIKRAVAIP